MNKDVIENLDFKKEKIIKNNSTVLRYRSEHKIGEPYFNYILKFIIDGAMNENIICEIYSDWNGSETLPINFELSKAIYQKMCELKGVKDDE